ncbi:Ethanolamine utilization protein EutG [Photobacterium marinum]|uniref:Ethanolamine utilization protein EutG n=1 Tax=Photobacterium marinum TaxID=1056511 RepID=L8JJV5_9GAMM|nr:iron-containing alcohol dehydrogenase [Photobacterium marinum]ELR67744.1 Ethanolamine utilization protein EutG [Photobacterium marinum]
MTVSSNEIASIVQQTLQQYQPYRGFTFRSPSITVTGGHCVNQLGEVLNELGATHVLLVADKVVHQLGLTKGCETAITFAGLGLTVFSDVDGEPDSTLIAHGQTCLEQSNADFVLGIGGGSALDAAKAIAVIGDYRGPLTQLKVGGIASRRVGLGAIPTTAGTGSEVTDITVIKDITLDIKVPVKGPALVPDLALLDPALMLNVPAGITAATGIDTLTHAIESYVSRLSNPLSKAYAYHSIETLIKALPIAVGYGHDMDKRYDMAVAAYKAGLAFSNAGLGLTHAIAHQIGARYHLAHGVANAILLPYVMAFNALSCEAGYAEVANALGVSREGMTSREKCRAAILAVRQLVMDLGLPTSLTGVGMTESDFPQLAEQAMKDICLQGNPRQVTPSQIITLLKQVMGGQLPEGYC